MSRILSQEAAANLTPEPSPELGEHASGKSCRSGTSAFEPLIEAAYEVFWQLRQLGDNVDPDEFCARYPAIQTSLSKMLVVHRWLDGLPDERDSNDWPEPGDNFAGFKLLRELGRGGRARVFEALEPALGERHVVVKIASRNQGEAATLGRIAHPNIVPVYSVTEEEMTRLTAVCMPFLGRATLLHVLEHVYGRQITRSKAAVILEAVGMLNGVSTHAPTRLHGDADGTEQKSAPPRVLRHGVYVDGIRWLAIQLADALAFIHAKGICHWDLKPSNILMRPNGTPMLMDFNLAANLDRPHASLFGTPAYMSPERIRALSQLLVPPRPDVRCDLYSLGVILYELLTGTHPFGAVPVGDKCKVVTQFLLERQPRGFRPIRELRSDVDSALARIVERCLAFEAKDRPDAREVARALRRSQGLRARVVRWLRRRPKMAAAACLAFSLVAFAGTYHLATRPPRQVAQFQLGRKAFDERDFHRAAYYFTESLRAQPDLPEVLVARGRAYLNLAEADRKYYGLASADFGLAVKLAPEGRFKVYLAFCLQKQKQILPAISLYEEALNQGFQTAEVHNNLAQLLIEHSLLAKAQENLDQALRINPKMAVAHYNQAILCYQKALASQGHPFDEERFLKKGIDEFRQAGDPSAMTGVMTLTGAAMCARASRFDERLTTPAIDYLGTALKQGIDPRKVVNEPIFARISSEPRFQALISQPPPANPPPTAAITVVEPVTHDKTVQ